MLCSCAERAVRTSLKSQNINTGPEWDNRALQRYTFGREDHMGVTHVTARIRSLTGKGPGYEAEFLVDTGAIDCMAPASQLKAAGVKPEGKAVYELADGRPVEMRYGFARVSFVGAETVAQVIFGPENAEPILGVVALENTGITVDPTTRTLRRLHAKPLKHRIRRQPKPARQPR
jgi:clan AA aspartic protease